MKGFRTPAETLEHLRKQAKRRLKEFRSGDKRAISWYHNVVPNPLTAPALRDMQHAVARSLDFPGWAALKQALDTPLPDPRSTEGVVNRFLDNACPDHHVRGKQDHRRAVHTAMRLLERHPEIARYDFNTAVVCGDIDYVRTALARDPRVAIVPSAPPSAYRAMAGGANDLYGNLGPKGWTPLLYLAFTRLPLAAANDNAVAIARLLLDAGADPNAYFHAGNSHYTPMTGVAGEGEEDRPPHPQRNELVQLLLEYGANPYDIQVVYNLGFHSEYLWWLPMIYDHCAKTGRADDWRDPEWTMLGMGGYGSGAQWFLSHALSRGNTALAEWCIAHGANPVYARATEPATPMQTLIDAAMQLDRARVEAILREHPDLRSKPDAMFRAAEKNREDVLTLLIDAGFSPDVADDKNTRPLNCAAMANALAAAKVLVARGADVDNTEQNYGGTPLGNASHFLYREFMDFIAPLSRDVWNLTYNGYLDRLREVLAEKPGRARVDWDTWSPLLWLPPHDEDLALEIAKLLVSHGADPQRRDSTGVSPADRAEAIGMTRVAQYLANTQRQC